MKIYYYKPYNVLISGQICEECNKIKWIPGHPGIGGTEKVDELAKEGSRTAFIGPEPLLAMSKQTIKIKLEKW